MIKELQLSNMSIETDFLSEGPVPVKGAELPFGH